MKIESFRFPDGIWEYQGLWRATLNINDVYDAFMLKIKNGIVDYEVYYEESHYSKDKTDKLIETALKNEEVKTEIEKIKYLIKEVEKVKKIENDEVIKLQVKKYKINDNWETFSFIFDDIDLLFNYTMNENITEVYSNTHLLADDTFYISEIDLDFSKDFTNKIIKKVRKSPIARIKRIYK